MGGDSGPGVHLISFYTRKEKDVTQQDRTMDVTRLDLDCVHLKSVKDNRVPDWLKTNRPTHNPSLHEQNLRAENLRLKERIKQLEDALKVSANWADTYRKRCKQLEIALKEGAGADE